MNIRIYYRILTICFLLIVLNTAAYASGNSAITTSLTVRVGDKEKTAQSLVKFAERLGGYFSLLNDNTISVKIPSNKTDLFLQRVAKSAEVIKKSYETKDYTFELNRKKSNLKAKKKVLKQYMDVLKESSTGNLLYVESEVVNLVGEIEQLEGSIRYLNHILDFSTVVVDFKFRNRQGPKGIKPSSFQWLNSLSLSNLVWSFRNE